MVAKNNNDYKVKMNDREQLDFLQSILDSSTEYSIAAVDMEGTILAWNAGATKIYGYEASDVIGKNARLVFTPDDLDSGRFLALLDEVKKNGFWTGEMQRIRKNGTQFTVLTTVTLRKNAQNEPIGFTAIARDLTELQKTLGLLNEVTASQTSLLIKNKELEELAQQAREATRLKNEFIANVSHELRSPLNGIIGYTQILVDGLVDAQSTVHKEFLNNILSCSYQLLHLVNDVLDLAKIESGKMTFHYLPVDLTKLVTEIENIFHMRLVNKNILFRVEIDPSLHEVITDPDKLKQIFYNYISNAIKFTDKNGQITIRISPYKNNTFRLEVQDTGIGIPKNDMHRLFVTFQQLDTGAAKKYQGTGLGLALTKRIVEVQGGEVGVESIVGKGSIFYAVLPLTPIIGNFNPRQNKERKPKSILVIENELTRNEHMLEALDAAGYEVISAANPETLKDSENKFDVIILDLLHLNPDRWEIVRHLRAQKISAKVLITVTTTKPISIGFKINEFITKPIDEQKLILALENVGIYPQMNKTILVLDSDKTALSQIENILTKKSFNVICQTQADSAIHYCRENKPDAVILDPFMAEMSGFEFLHAYRQTEYSLTIPLIICVKEVLSENERSHFSKAIQRLVLQDEDAKKSMLAEIQQELPPTD